MQSETIFKQFISQSRYLYEPYHFKDFIKLSNEITEAIKREENAITFAYSSSQPIDSSFYVSSKEPTIINEFF